MRTRTGIETVPAVASPTFANNGREAVRRLRWWRVVAAVVFIGGVVACANAARLTARQEVRDSRHAFASTSADITANLELAIQHEEDLTVGVGGFIISRPDAGNSAFIKWSQTIRAFERYPELRGMGVIRYVPAAQVAEFTARAATDPTGPLGAGGKYQILPIGKRSFYCLSQVGQWSTTQLMLPAGYDYCSGSSDPTGRDSAEGAYQPLKIGGETLLAVQTPLYRTGRAPTTVAERRREFIGWVGVVVSPRMVLTRALTGHPGTAVVFRYNSGALDVTFRAGDRPSHAQSRVTDLRNGWTVTTYGNVPGGAVWSSLAATGVLLGGTALTGMLAALVYVLATGRLRALAMVREKTAELRHQSLHDTLTDLPNRDLILDRIAQLEARSRRTGTGGAALILDLDRFKDVNDTRGHTVGDALLKAVGARLTSALRDADTIGRMGGDEFVILIDDAALPSAPELVAERIMGVIRQPFELEGIPVVITTSIGIAAGLRKSPSDLLREAEMALYKAKAAGGNCFAVFRPEMGTDVQHRYQLEFDLRAALDSDQFLLMYQPIYRLDDVTLTGVEALIRWRHPTRGLIPPDEFIPLLESSDQIVGVGRWAMHEACRQMAAWRALGHDLTVAVNVSARQLDHDVLVADVRDALAESGLAPAALTVELTETALMRDTETTSRRLRELKALGVRVAIDDFGTGYSSLAYLQRFPVDALKIDRMFTATITHSAESEALIHTLVQLGKNLGLTTVAEGVETREQMIQLRGEGVDEVQGFLLSKPLDVAEMDKLLLAYEALPNPGRHAGTIQV